MRARTILQFAWAHAMALALAASASAVIIDSGDGSGNAYPLDQGPDPEPSWSWRNVGTIGGLSGVYIGGKFVLTAYHVGAGNIVLDGVTYQYVPGTARQLGNGEPTPNTPCKKTTCADLLMFEIYPEPPLPELAIANSAPPPLPTTELILVGHGLERGTMTTWDPPDPPNMPPTDPIDGYYWGSGNSMRWGTNAMDGVPFEIFYPPLNTFTMAFETDFDGPGPTQTDHECQAAVGDSGGATFASTPTTGWQLAGIMFLIAGHESGEQPPGTALYTNTTYSVNLSSYHDQIMAMPEPGGGLWPGAAVVAMLARRRRARQSFARSITRR